MCSKSGRLSHFWERVEILRGSTQEEEVLKGLVWLQHFSSLYFLAGLRWAAFYITGYPRWDSALPYPKCNGIKWLWRRILKTISQKKPLCKLVISGIWLPYIPNAYFLLLLYHVVMRQEIRARQAGWTTGPDPSITQNQKGSWTAGHYLSISETCQIAAQNSIPQPRCDVRSQNKRQWLLDLRVGVLMLFKWPALCAGCSFSFQCFFISTFFSFNLQ